MRSQSDYILTSDVPDFLNTNGVCMGNTISELQKRTGEVNTANGWREPMNTQVAEYLAMHMLIVTEVSELAEEIREGNPVDRNYYTINGKRVFPVTDGSGADWTTDHVGLAHTPYCEAFTGVIPKPEGVPSELADVVIRCLDFADKFGIDLDAALTEKLEYNRSRGYRHGGKTI